MMKRVLALSVMLLVMIGAYLNVHADVERTDIPPMIQDVLTTYTNCGYHIQSFSTMSTGEWSAVTLQHSNGHNLFYLFRFHSNTWSCYLQTDKVVFQGTKFVDAYFDEGTSVFDTGRKDISFKVTTPTLTIGQMNSDQEGVAEYFERSMCFTLMDERWLLISWDDFDFSSVYLSDHAMCYSGSWITELQPWYGTVNGTVERDIRKASIFNIPRTYEEAKQAFLAPTDAPSED